MTSGSRIDGESRDADLIRLVVAGDADAFGEIVVRHQHSIYRTALAIMRDESEADSITQETFVQAWRSLHRFEARSSLETWLTRIAINKARDELRRKKRFLSAREPEALHTIRDARPGAEQRLLASELATVIAAVLDTLPSKQRTIFALHHFDDRPLQEIAEVLGIAAATARVHLHRATKRIRKALAPFHQTGSAP